MPCSLAHMTFGREQDPFSRQQYASNDEKIVAIASSKALIMSSQRPLSAASLVWQDHSPSLPEIHDDDQFADLVWKLSLWVPVMWNSCTSVFNVLVYSYFVEAVETPHTFEELRTLPHGRPLIPLIGYLSDHVTNRAIVSALL